MNHTVRNIMSLANTAVVDKRFSVRFARILSYVFDGSFISIPILIAISLIVVEDKVSALGWASLGLLFGVLIPFLYVFFLYRKRRIKSMHIPLRRNRIKPLAIACISYSAGLLVLYLLDGPSFLKSIFAISAISTTILTIITYYWKISLHTSYITFVVITFHILFGKWMFPLILLVPTIGWARIKIKKHTISQVVLGVGISSVTTFTIYYSYGFINLF